MAVGPDRYAPFKFLVRAVLRAVDGIGKHGRPLGGAAESRLLLPYTVNKQSTLYSISLGEWSLNWSLNQSVKVEQNRRNFCIFIIKLYRYSTRGVPHSGPTSSPTYIRGRYIAREGQYYKQHHSAVHVISSGPPRPPSSHMSSSACAHPAVVRRGKSEVFMITERKE